MVIVAHGASIPLARQDGVLRVLISASLETRAQRLMAEEGTTKREATNRVTHSDRERRNFFRRFYNLREELPTHYDLVVNTDKLTTQQAMSLIVTAAKG